jgi:hypothetical protein
MQNGNYFNDTSLPPGQDRQTIKRCPRCRSVFIDDQQCQSCGLQKRYFAMGEPLSERSFYGLKDHYVESLPGLIQHVPLLERKRSPLARIYQKKLLARFDELLEFFVHDANKDPNQWGLYYLELKDLLKELLSMPVDRDILWQKLEVAHDRPFYQGLAAIILEKRAAELSAPTFLSKRFAGLRWGFILLFGVTSIFLFYFLSTERLFF